MAKKRLIYKIDHTDCYTYFRITGDFDAELISNMLNLKPETSWNVGDLRKDGKSRYEFSACKFNTCSDYDIDVCNQMEKTIEPLLKKVEILKQIKTTYNVNYYLVVVPKVRYDEPSPCLAPSKQVMKFCVDTDTEIDIDLYVACPDDAKDGIPIV